MGQDKDCGYTLRDGFSLVEVIIAVTVLAILTLPILSYFTNASVSTSRGKNTQRANLAGETAMEELNALDTIEDLFATAAPSASSDPSATSEPSSPSPTWNVTEDAANNKTNLEKDVTMDGFEYHIVATADYNYATKDGNGKENSYNAYAIPELKEVDAADNAVIEETDQEEIALSDFYYENPEETKLNILKNMKRALCVDVEQQTESLDDGVAREVYWVRGYYRIKYKSKEEEYTIKEVKVEKDALKNIYVFYKILNGETDDKIYVKFKNISKDTDVENLNLYFVLQDTSATTTGSSFSKPSGYKVSINPTTLGADYPNFKIADAGTAYSYANYFTNGIDLGTSPVTKFDKSVVKYATGRRIAKITVDVYERRSGSSYPESDRLVRLESSKGQ